MHYCTLCHKSTNFIISFIFLKGIDICKFSLYKKYRFINICELNSSQCVFLENFTIPTEFKKQIWHCHIKKQCVLIEYIDWHCILEFNDFNFGRLYVLDVLIWTKIIFYFITCLDFLVWTFYIFRLFHLNLVSLHPSAVVCRTFRTLQCNANGDGCDSGGFGCRRYSASKFKIADRWSMYFLELYQRGVIPYEFNK